MVEVYSWYGRKGREFSQEDLDRIFEEYTGRPATRRPEAKSRKIEDGKQYKVRRRYQDFLWLTDKLEDNYPERLIPPLPDKNRLEYLGRFTPDFIKRRQAGLKRFLNRIDRHPRLLKSEEMKIFLQSPVIGVNLDRMASYGSINMDTTTTNINNSTDSLSLNEQVNAATCSNKNSSHSLLEGIGDVITSTFSKIPQNIDDRFLKLRKNVQLIRGHFSQLEKLYRHRITGQQPMIVEGMKEIAINFDELSSAIDIELRRDTKHSNTITMNTESDYNNSHSTGLVAPSPSFVKSMLSRVSATMTQCANILEKSSDEQEINLLTILNEYVQYCDAALELILQRDRRQVEYEDLKKMIEGYERELHEIRGVSSTSTVKKEESIENGDTKEHNNTEHEQVQLNDEQLIPELQQSDSASSSTMNNINIVQSGQNQSLYSYLSMKWDSWRGIDPISSRQSRQNRIESHLKEAREGIKISEGLFNRANTTLIEEIDTFELIIRSEFGDELGNHMKGQVKYHETNLVYWKDFLSWLANPPKHL